jgi:hypothetical protein
VFDLDLAVRVLGLALEVDVVVVSGCIDLR